MPRINSEGREKGRGLEGRSGRRREGKGRGEGRRAEGGEGRGEEAFLVMWPRRLSALNPPLETLDDTYTCRTDSHTKMPWYRRAITKYYTQ